MLQTTWRGGSLRFRLAVGMALAIVPLAVAAVVGYGLLDRHVVSALQDVAHRQRDQIRPVRQLQLALWDAVAPIALYLDGGHPEEPGIYRAERQRIEAAFARLDRSLAREPNERLLLERARDDWTVADDLATEIISVRRRPGDPDGLLLMERLEGRIQAAVGRLEALADTLEKDVDEDHTEALTAYERAQWIAGAAAVASVLLMTAGVTLIGHTMLASVDRLVEGATRFAAGDRDHRIEIQVPPELHTVADAFNRMIVRIHESEGALADLARRDGLTGLLNRRAFDEALADAVGRVRLSGEPVSLLMLDLDHFKQINDGFGHAAGDDVLRAVARTMLASVRGIDKPFRIGGEEFAILLPSADAPAAATAAERLRAAVAAAPVQADRHEIAVTVSIGVAVATDEAQAKVLPDAADAALYRAKAEGRNRVVLEGR